MVYVIHGATGAQGSPIVSALAARNRTVLAAVRDTGAVPDGTASVSVDLADAAALADAYTRAEGVFVHLPMGAPDNAAAQAEAVAAAVASARPARVVVSTSGQVVDQPGSTLQAGDDRPITTLIRRLTATGVPTAVVAPRLYLENLLLPVIAAPACDDGVLRYPLPASFPVSWSSHLDVAEVVVGLLADATTVTGTVAVGHLPALTGPDLAAAFASHLGREVRYEAITPEAFGDLITPLFGPAAAPVVGLYRALQVEEGNTIAMANSAQVLLGCYPRPVTRWLVDAGL